MTTCEMLEEKESVCADDASEIISGQMRKAHMSEQDVATEPYSDGGAPSAKAAVEKDVLENARGGACDEAEDARQGVEDDQVEPLRPGVEKLEEEEVIDAHELGRRGEDAAVRYLKVNGYEILERNWECAYGECDIIAEDLDSNTVCFVEVKTRRSIEAGIPEEAVTRAKQRRYEKIAMSYMMESDWDEGLRIRFDCIGICVTDRHRALLRHHRACFDVVS